MHIFKEDNILFEIVNSGLSDTDDRRVLAGFEIFDKAFESPRHDRLLHRLQMLERKYLPVAT
jgi:hemerythrin-like domain-containing protein